MSNGYRVTLALMVGALVGSCSGVWAHGLGARPGTPQEHAEVDALYGDVHAVRPNDLSRLRAAEEGKLRTQAETTAARPLAVDNSALRWFPPIGDQGEQNSCVAWAAGYYYDTYTQAMDEGIDVSHGDHTHICSPSFLYPLVNDGIDDGAYLQAALARLTISGCSSLDLTPYRESDYTTWPSEAAWVDALTRRTTDLYQISDHTASGLEAVKQLLANGRVGVLMIDIYANLYDDYPVARGVDSDVLYAPDGPCFGGHSITLVGYDDTKAYFDARDGQTHVGAFLAANSWGSAWGAANTKGDRGFVWISYDAFLAGAFVYDVFYTDDRPHYRPAVYALVGVDAEQRGGVDLRAGTGLPSAPAAVTGLVLHHSGGTQAGLDNSHRIAVDLTDLSPALTGGRLGDVFISLGVSSGASSPADITSVEFHTDLDGDGKDEVAEVPRLPVEVAVGATGYGFLPLFLDLTWNQWAYPDIEACFAAGVVAGYADETYHPATPVTRDQMAVYVSRALAGSDAAVPSGPSTATFTDVPVGYWAFRYVEYAAARGIVQGYGDGTYQPGLVVDRGAMAVYIARAIAGSDGAVPDPDDTGPSFPDVPADFWSAKYIAYLQQAGVTSGYADGKYHPEYVVTRDLMAVYIARAFKLEQ